MCATTNGIHEVKHDGYRLMAQRDPVGVRLITRRGNDWTTRFPLVAEAVNHLKVRSCLIDGEVVCCDEKGMAISSSPAIGENEPQAFLYAFDFACFRKTDDGSCSRGGRSSIAAILRRGCPGSGRWSRPSEHPRRRSF